MGKAKKKAVAVKYLKEDLDVPVISAYGEDKLAEMIIKCATENGIEIVNSDEIFQYQDLFNIGREIPFEIYKLIAEIISSIIKTNNEVFNEQ